AQAVEAERTLKVHKGRPADSARSVPQEECDCQAFLDGLPQNTAPACQQQVIESDEASPLATACEGNEDLVGSEVVLCSGARHRNLHELAAKHAEVCGLQMPTVEILDMPSLRLQAEGDGKEADVQVLITDKEMDVNRKMKKAFCQPGNAEFCPPIDWVEAMLPAFGEFMVKRKPENGGDQAYGDAELIRKDFASEALHPGDLKTSLGKALNAAMAEIRLGLKKPELKKAQNKLNQYIKSLQKKK
ncbi:unnamed protein product, partial [Effrenium voratum]